MNKAETEQCEEILKQCEDEINSVLEKHNVTLEADQFYNGCWVSPTTIGAIINGGHSSVGTPVCKEMVIRGLAERNDKGHYRLKT